MSFLTKNTIFLSEYSKIHFPFSNMIEYRHLSTSSPIFGFWTLLEGVQIDILVSESDSAVVLCALRGPPKKH